MGKIISRVKAAFRWDRPSLATMPVAALVAFVALYMEGLPDGPTVWVNWIYQIVIFLLATWFLTGLFVGIITFMLEKENPTFLDSVKVAAAACTVVLVFFLLTDW